jgi:2,5-diketo-D-gluconate reductase A
VTAGPTVTLANGVAMPALGLGTWPLDNLEAEATVAAAIAAGYRLIDTAENYGNERGVGRAVRASGVGRDELFVTSKFDGRWHSVEGVRKAFARSARRLGLERIDLFLIHWPLPARGRYVDAWRGLIRLLEDGDVRAIGVSNFKPAHLERLLAATGVAPHVNQIQLNPWIVRAAERRFHAEHGIVTESWAPLGKGGDLLAEPAVVRAARRHGRTPAQVVLRWHLQLGLVAIPKTAHPRRLVENLAVFDFALDADEMAEITALDRGGVGVIDSDVFGH